MIIFYGLCFGIAFMCVLNQMFVPRKHFIEISKCVQELNTTILHLKIKQIRQSEFFLNNYLLKAEYEKDCSEKVKEELCGELSARAEESVESDQKSVQ